MKDARSNDPMVASESLVADDDCLLFDGVDNQTADIWAHHRLLPAVHEGDLLALLPAGAHGASMSSDHCLRGQVKEIVL